MTKKTRRSKARRALLALSLVLVTMLVTVGGTVAWLTANTAPVVNTFTPSNINIELTETTGNQYKMVPGATIAKNPKVTVKSGSEASYVFVKIEKSTDKAFDDYMTFTIAAGWTALPNVAGVYYREVAATTADTDFPVLMDNQVQVKDTVTKTMMDALNVSNYPKLTFTAYAVQQAKGNTTFTPAEAWAKVPTTAAP